jgi:hypothetical protein
MTDKFPRPPFADQHQPMPGSSAAMDPQPDYGEDSYEGSGRLTGKSDEEWDVTFRTNIHVAPGPIWTPLIPSTMPEEKVKSFGSNTPLGRAGQPVELAPVYVLLASDEASYISGARVAVTGGRPML